MNRQAQPADVPREANALQGDASVATNNLEPPKLPVHTAISPAIPNVVFQNTNSDGTFVVGTGNTVYNLQDILLAIENENQVKEKLRALIVLDATHIGKVRGRPLGCDPNTREAIIEDIIFWMEDSERDHNVMWLRGPAGIGKSAIARTTAKRVDSKDSKAVLAGSFFFFRGDPKRNNLDHVIHTLAHQLATAVEAVGKEIYNVIRKNPDILDSDLEVQWRKLIVDPIMAVESLPPMAMIIDGLDECGNDEDQCTILEFIALCGPRFPVAFLVCSRPEPNIANSFDAEPLVSLCRTEIDLATCKDDREMRAFVVARFSKLYARYRDILRYYARDGIWPSAEVVDQIVDKADGQFIYPVTLFRYIEVSNANPHKQLEYCLAQGPEALTPLDALYLQILQASHEPHDTQIQDVLFLLLPASNREAPTLRLLSSVLGVDPASLRCSIRKLHSVIDVPRDDYNELSIYHQSFMDFLLDPNRSSAYCINQRDSAIRVIGGSLSALEQYPDSAGDLIPILQSWWSCSLMLSHENISVNLLSRMEQLDFEGILKVFPGNRGIEFLGLCYKDFIGACQSWVTLGGDGPQSSQVTEHWKKSSLLTKFKPDTILVAKEAQELSKRFKEFHKKLNDVSIGICPVSWNGLLVLAQAELDHEPLPIVTRRWKIGHPTDNFVYTSLLVFLNEALVQKLSEGDLVYLSTWSRCWEEHWKYHVSFSMNPYPDPRQIAELLRTLPKERHYHELNRAGALPWLKWTYERFSKNPYNNDTSAYEDVLKHWETNECSGDMTEN
ncbi:hypothetical protein AX16_001347 [Volvariella volvacea WC 439]|nr:hypothetical protein AX16_001347 [Volvariella volvacea WC 439]